MLIEQVARICHEANRIYCQQLGDSTQQAWELSPEWQRSSALDGVAFHLEHPGATPEQSHEAWLEGKLAAGWVYGPEKDADKKLHPCCVPYEDLPEEQKVKDYLFRGIIHALSPFIQGS